MLFKPTLLLDQCSDHLKPYRILEKIEPRLLATNPDVSWGLVYEEECGA
jgi:hypothetical protein